MKLSLYLLILTLIGCSGADTSVEATTGTDFHTHIHSPPKEADDMEFNAQRVLMAADSIGLSRSLLLPNAYGRNVTEPYAIQENNFIHAEVSQNPVRLAGACTVNPAKNWAYKELNRCHTLGLKVLKLHLMASGLDLKKEEDYKIAKATLINAATLNFTVIVHANYPSKSRGNEIEKLKQLIEEFPQIRFIIAHLFGREHAVLKTLKHPNFFVEVSGTPIYLRTKEAREDLVKTIREVGIDKFLFGSDWPVFHQAETLKALKALPLSALELKKIQFLNASQLNDLFAQ